MTRYILHELHFIEEFFWRRMSFLSIFNWRCWYSYSLQNVLDNVRVKTLVIVFKCWKKSINRNYYVRQFEVKTTCSIFFLFQFVFITLYYFTNWCFKVFSTIFKHAKKTLLYTYIFIDTYILHVTETVTANFAKKIHKINFLFFRTLEKSEFTDNIDKSQVLIFHALTIIFLKNSISNLAIK